MMISWKRMKSRGKMLKKLGKRVRDGGKGTVGFRGRIIFCKWVENNDLNVKYLPPCCVQDRGHKKLHCKEQLFLILGLEHCKIISLL